MADTSYNVGPQKRDRVVTRHQRSGEGILSELPNDEFAPVTFFPGGGGLVSTAPDYVRLMQMILNEGEGRERVLSPDSVSTMSRNQIGAVDVVNLLAEFETAVYAQFARQ